LPTPGRRRRESYSATAWESEGKGKAEAIKAALVRAQEIAKAKGVGITAEIEASVKERANEVFKK
jgi:hypothetical protein